MAKGLDRNRSIAQHACLHRIEVLAPNVMELDLRVDNCFLIDKDRVGDLDCSSFVAGNELVGQPGAEIVNAPFGFANIVFEFGLFVGWLEQFVRELLVALCEFFSREFDITDT